MAAKPAPGPAPASSSSAPASTPTSSFVAGFQRWLVAAVAASGAEAFTFPLDVTKTRLQLQGELGKTLTGEAATTKDGMMRTLVRVWTEEGPSALYRGLPAAVIRQSVYGGIGVGMYAPVRRLVIGEGVDPDHAALWKRILAGAITGGFGQLVASPTDVVKVRIQADGRLRLLGKEPRYRGTFDAFRRIPKEEGFAGFFRGLGPSVSRAAVINGCGIASYDHSKQLTKRLTGAEEGLTARVTGALISGLVSALVSSPFDVVKSRLMNQPAGSTLYSGMVDCAMKTARAEGVMALYKGFTPAYARLAPWQLVFFLSFEQLNLWMFGKTL